MTTGHGREAGVSDIPSAQLMPRDLADDIASELESAGEYRAVLDPRQPQRLVDLRWAALAAGRILGRKVKVVMTRAVHDTDAPITVRVVDAPILRPAIPPQRGYGV